MRRICHVFELPWYSGTVSDLGEGGFGKMLQGRLDTGEDVAVKLLVRNGLQKQKRISGGGPHVNILCRNHVPKFLDTYKQQPAWRSSSRQGKHWTGTQDEDCSWCRQGIGLSSMMPTLYLPRGSQLGPTDENRMSQQGDGNLVTVLQNTYDRAIDG
ncbi:hypothetical protein HPP92_001129 [Vanilla planifolia]|uniref:Uncharacterized protein n=1 Tax=Vanilla planifolia TaxID=51239 RepID=A0A835SBE0_VANPL|nr:hypothetical protein HPP92_001129 [Vanilla planifolia]